MRAETLRPDLLGERWQNTSRQTRPTPTTDTKPVVSSGAHWAALLALMLVSSALLLYQLDSHSLSVDEYVNVVADAQPLSEIGRWLGSVGGDLHPPLTHLISHASLMLFGQSDWAARAAWALSSVIGVAATYRLGRALGTQAEALLAAALLATSPTLLLYGRLVKYYAFTLLVAVVLTLVFVRLVHRYTAARLLAYAALLIVLVYTDYFGILICVLWQDLYLGLRVLAARRREAWVALGRVLAAQLAAGLLFLPWVSVAMRQAQGSMLSTEVDLGSGWLGIVVKLAFGVYSFAVGETLFPWHPLALAATLAAGLAGLCAVWAAWRRRSRLGRWSGTYTLLSMGSLAILTTTVITVVPFVSFANHILFTLPFFMLWLVSGVQHIRPALARVGLAGVLLAAHAVGLANYYAGRDFLNPIYAVPTRDVVAIMAESVAPTDVVLAEADTGIAFYASRRRGWQAPIWPPDAAGAQATIQRLQPGRVWVFSFGRDHSRSPVVTNARLWLEDHHYQVVETQGYAEQDTTYRWVKEQLFHRPAYQYKLTLFIYQRQP